MEKFTSFVENSREYLKERFMPAMAICILLFLFLVAGGGVSQDDKWRVDNIVIGGANAVSTDDIHNLVKEKLLGQYFFVYARENIYLYPRREIELTLLEKFPRLANARMARIDAHTISVNVSERKPYALWCGENISITLALNGCWFIDDMGFVFDRAPIFSPGVYMEVYGKLDEKNKGEPLRARVPSSRFATANAFAKSFHVEIGEPARIALKDESELDMTIRMSGKFPFLAGVTIMFKDEETSANLIKNLLTSIPVQFPDNGALKNKLLYIDMRFGNKIFFGFEE